MHRCLQEVEQLGEKDTIEAFAFVERIHLTSQLVYVTTQHKQLTVDRPLVRTHRDPRH